MEVSPAVRWATRSYLALLVVFGLFSLELWPLTSFHLFSNVRTRERPAYRVARVDGTGEEHTVVLHQLPLTYQYLYVQIRDDFPGATQAHRDAVCDDLRSVLEDKQLDTQFIRIYRSYYDVVDGHLVREKLRWNCGTAAP